MLIDDADIDGVSTDRRTRIGNGRELVVRSARSPVTVNVFVPLPVAVAWPLVYAVSAPLPSLMVTVSGNVSVFGSLTDGPSKDGTAVIAVSIDAAVITGGGTMTVPVTVSVCAASA